MIRVRPRAAGTIDSIKLIEMSERRDSAHEPWLFEGELRGGENGFHSSRNLRRSPELNRIRLNWRLSIGRRVIVPGGFRGAVSEVPIPHINPH